MTDISSNLESPALDAGSGRTCKHRSHRSLRRKRSLFSTIKHHLDQMLRTRKIFRAGFVLLPLAGFLQVSHMNDVLVPHDKASDAITSEQRVVNNGGSTASDAETLKNPRSVPDLFDDRPVVAPTNVMTFVSVTQLASAWSTGDLRSWRLSPDESDIPEAASAGSTNAEPMISDTATTGGSFRKTNAYVVNEGGSLWRTGKRFIDDEVLLDKLIDNLSESGMDVRSVSAGVEFIVNDLGSKGLLVVVEDDGDTYESRIVKDSVTSSVRPQAASGVDSSRTASLEP